jgi:glycosyltransferase involved in cell wall biosynthesis
MAQGLAAHGFEVSFDVFVEDYDIVLVVGGTRHLGSLWKARRRGVPIVHRLNGMNWLHKQLPTGVRHYLRSEYGNLILRIIRDRLADRIVYQSQFAQDWWERTWGTTSAPAMVIHNGVDLADFHPDGPHNRPSDRHRLLLVEGNLMGGYELGLAHAAGLGRRLNARTDLPVEVQVVGRVPQAVQTRHTAQGDYPLMWAGQIPRSEVPLYDRSAHALYAADLNPACPNAVIEALACGLPVLALQTGALPELVTAEAGRLVPYGGDPWKLDPPDLEGLADAAEEILGDQPRLRAGARALAEARFSLDRMVKAYLEVLFNAS